MKIRLFLRKDNGPLTVTTSYQEEWEEVLAELREDENFIGCGSFYVRASEIVAYHTEDE